MPQFRKVRHILFSERRVLQKSPQSWESFLYILSPTWADLRFHLCKGSVISSTFQDTYLIENYHFHTHVQYCITIHYHSCSIDAYINVDGPKCHNFGWLGISCFHPKAGRVSYTSFTHLSWFDVPPMPGVWDIIYLSGHLSDWPIRTSTHMYSTV